MSTILCRCQHTVLFASIFGASVSTILLASINQSRQFHQPIHTYIFSRAFYLKPKPIFVFFFGNRSRIEWDVRDVCVCVKMKVYCLVCIYLLLWQWDSVCVESMYRCNLCCMYLVCVWVWVRYTNINLRLETGSTQYVLIRMQLCIYLSASLEIYASVYVCVWLLTLLWSEYEMLLLARVLPVCV